MCSFNFKQEQNFNVSLESVTHLLDYANQIGVNTAYIAGLDSTMEQEQLLSVSQQLEQAIKQEQELALAVKLEQEKRERYACHIGPYANGICTICGGLQP